ncbi:alanine--tRNA ligase [Alicyclobacillaceae bacterium I2511]|nr:alanine--tRNA ligase [Alicyclobacillaceae bacterium I2511]
MKSLTGQEIRHEFLDFFARHGHQIMPSASLVPHNDPTLLWIGAGMAPLKPYFDGREIPENPRITTVQKCIRTNDIENVGFTARHQTMFEMLGNFSFGDYFKEDAIHWAWEFLTEILELDPHRLWATVHHTDEEAYAIWHEQVGVPAQRIVRGDEDNFWEIGEGPSGPCSEIYFDRGEHYGCGRTTCQPGCECDRYLEVWNLVFTQYNKGADGQYTPLPKKNIDTGMGLERIASVLQGVPNNFETDLFFPLLRETARLAGVQYGNNPQQDTQLKIIADHLRTVVFAVGDGVLPGNEGRSYIIRRLLRRAVRSGRKLGLNRPFLHQVAPVVANLMGHDYPEVAEKQAFIQRVIHSEEERFRETLAEGENLLHQKLAEVKRSGGHQLAGEDAFRLYDTFGFPIDLTEEIVAESEMGVDRIGFTEQLTAQRERARAARQQSEGMNSDRNVLETISVASRFVGYERLRTDSRIEVMVKGMAVCEQLQCGDEAEVILDVTPFYAESGGQLGDRGELVGPQGKAQVLEVRKAPHGQSVHQVRVIDGLFTTGDIVAASVAESWRMDIVKNHTATHLLQKALRDVLGSHVAQAGSLVEDSRLRFDFSHLGPLTPEELATVERQVNDAVWRDYPVVTQEMALDEAKALGAMALFGEKYGDRVRVVQAGDYSIELCGGCHVERTGVIGLFQIVSESGIGAGVRRIEGVTGRHAYAYILTQKQLLAETATKLHSSVEDLPTRTDRLLLEIRELERELGLVKARVTAGKLEGLLQEVRSVAGIQLLSTVVTGVDMEGLRQTVDMLRDRLDSFVIVLGSSFQGKAQFVAAVSKDLQIQGLSAGDIVKQVAQVAGGGGGGRPDMAQAGGKDPGKVPQAVAKVAEIVRMQAGKGTVETK